MSVHRPSLENLDPEVREYIEHLESELERLRARQASKQPRVRVEAEEELEELPELSEPAEPPTTINVITATATGIAKRTPRHLYTRQRRGGMGVFDLDAPDDDPPTLLALADESQSLLLISNLGRGFRLPVMTIPEGPVRARGATIIAKLGVGKPGLQEGERLVAILPIQAEGYVALASQSGMVRMLRHHVFGEHMKPGTALYDLKQFGPLAAACWTPGDADLFVAARSGKAIRFASKQIAPQGSLGMRVGEGDIVTGIASVGPASGVFLLSADGRGTIRQMEGFSANKAPGSGGKTAINTDHLLCALCVDEQEDIFIISRLSKIIRFRVEDVPPKEGVVQGVICINLRADEPVAATVNPFAAS